MAEAAAAEATAEAEAVVVVAAEDVVPPAPAPAAPGARAPAGTAPPRDAVELLEVDRRRRGWRPGGALAQSADADAVGGGGEEQTRRLVGACRRGR